jgi:N-acetylglucosaminyldiphosphoundecaprenol N-acetyl-beta-D-mannosaminyltransferase
MSSTGPGTVPSHLLLGVQVHAFDIHSLNGHVEQLIRSGQRAAIGHHNLHSVYLCERNAKMREFYDRAESVFIDGMSIVFAGRLLGLPLRRQNRITYVDWIHPLMALAEDRGWRVYYLGAAPGIVDSGAAMLRDRYPRLRLAFRHGYFDREQGSDGGSGPVVAEINRYRPDILLVGMGMPRQEEWILDNLDRLDAKVVLSSGGCMDYLAGAVPTPPRPMARLGLEWLFRFLAEPKRLARRTLLEPWFILPTLARELIDNRLLRRRRADRADRAAI